MIEFACKSCGKTLRARDELARSPVKCPGCGQAMRVPPLEDRSFRSEPAHDESTYELAEQPEGPWARPSAARVVPTPDPEPLKGEKTGKVKRGSPEAVAAASPTVNGGASPKTARWRQAFTPLVGVVALLAIAGLIGWAVYAASVGRDAMVITAQPVAVDVMLGQVRVEDRWDPLDAVSSSKRQAVPGVNALTQQWAHPYTLGGTDRVVTVAPGDGPLLVEVGIKVQTFRRLGKVRRNEVRLRSHDFELVADDGARFPATGLLGERYERAMAVDLDYASGNYELLVPPGTTPSNMRLAAKTRGGVPSGTLDFDGSTGPRGSVDFVDLHAASDGAPGVTGMLADGRVAVDGAAGTSTFDYDDDELLLTFPDEGVGWRLTDRFIYKINVSPYNRLRGSVLFDAPVDRSYELRYAGEPIASIRPRSRPEVPTVAPLFAAAEPTPAPAAGPPTAASASAGSSTGSGPGGGGGSGPGANVVRGYVDALLDGRERARSVVAGAGLQQLGLALQLYLADHRDQPPASLRDLAPYLGVDPSNIPNPRTQEKPGFVYVPPPAGAHPSRTAVLFEARNGRPDPTGGRVYLDGRVETSGHALGSLARPSGGTTGAASPASGSSSNP